MEDFRSGGKILQRLLTYGVANADQALTKARRAGWTEREIAELLAFCERQTIGRAKAYGPGAVFWQLANGPPGSRPTVPESEAYQRAKRDRDRQWQAERQAENLAPKEITAEDREKSLALLAAWHHKRKAGDS